MEFYKFVTLYRRELIPTFLLATILFQLWVYLQRRYNLYNNGWFVTGYMLFNMYSSVILFFYLIGEL